MCFSKNLIFSCIIRLIFFQYGTNTRQHSYLENIPEIRPLPKLHRTVEIIHRCIHNEKYLVRYNKKSET